METCLAREGESKTEGIGDLEEYSSRTNTKIFLIINLKQNIFLLIPKILYTLYNFKLHCISSRTNFSESCKYLKTSIIIKKYHSNFKHINPGW